jgi:type I restriction enzyme S subunit
MALKPGYKQTEVGVIPEDWRVFPIGDLVEKFRGGAPFKPSDFTDSGISVLPKGGVVRGGILDIEENEKQFCSPDFADAHLNNQVDSTYTIVVLRDLVPSGPSIGLMVKMPTSEIYVLAQGVYGFKVNEQVDARYLIQLSNTSIYRRLMNSIMVGSTQVHITNTSFKLARIFLPPTKTEQTAIASALSDADALIQSLSRLIAKKRQIKQGAMQALLNPYENGRLKEGWVVKKLGEVADIDPENLNASVNPNYKFKYISLEDVDRGVLQNYSDQIFETAPSRARRIVKKEDILFGTVRPNLQSHCLIKNHAEDLVCSTGFAVIRCRNNIANPPYIFSLFFAEFVEKQIQTLLAGSNYPAINSSDVRKLDIPLPQMDEQTHIAKILSDMDAEIAALETKLAKYRHIKQGMMQNLLTGRIRLVQSGSNTGAIA